MKKYKVSIPTEYADGHLRYGHLEAVIEANGIEELKEKAKKYDDYEFILDDYELNDYGSKLFDEIEIEEISNE